MIAINEAVCNQRFGRPELSFEITGEKVVGAERSDGTLRTPAVPAP